MMKNKVCKISAIVLMFVLTFNILAFGAGDVVTVQTVTGSDSICLFVRGIDDSAKDYKFQIGNKVCKDVSVRDVLDEPIPMQTLILVDNSFSIPKNDRDKIITFLNAFVSDRSEKEKFCIATFGEGLEIRAEMTSDYSNLKYAIDQLNFVDRDTYLTDVLYDLIDKINDENAPILSRIVVISDGVDNKNIGITKAELSDKLKETPYLIYTVGCSTGKNNEQLENMFSLSRQTNARSYLMDDYDDVVAIVRDISNDRGVKVVKPDLTEIDLDGSEQNSKLTYSIDGNEYAVETKIKLPFGDGVSSDEQPDNSGEESDVEEVHSAGEDSATGNEGIPLPVMIIIPVILVLIVVAGVAIKKHSDNKKRNVPDYVYSGNSGSDNDKTELLSDDDRTEIINDNSTQMLFEGEGGHVLRLADLKDPSITYQTSLAGTVVIGRKASSCSFRRMPDILYTS